MSAAMALIKCKTLMFPMAVFTMMVMGEVNGNMLKKFPIGLSGLVMSMAETMYENTNGNVTGSMNCCVSESLSTAAPMAAKREAYNKNPPMKKKINIPTMSGQLIKKIQLMASLFISDCAMAA